MPGPRDMALNKIHKLPAFKEPLAPHLLFEMFLFLLGVSHDTQSRKFQLRSEILL